MDDKRREERCGWWCDIASAVMLSGIALAAGYLVSAAAKAATRAAADDADDADE